MNRSILLPMALVLHGALVLPLAAQAPALEGRKVRVTVAATGGTRRREAVVRSWDADSLRLVPSRGAGDVAVSWGDVRKVEYVAGRSNAAGKGALIGAIFGGAFGLAADISCAGAEGWDSIGCPPTGAATAAGAAFWGGIGALIGLAFKRDKWVGEPTPFELRSTVQEGRPGIAVSLRF